MYKIELLYKNLIMEHSSNPHNKYILKKANYKLKGYNSNCGDIITVYIYINNDVINEISFIGTGCALSIASTSIMVKLLHMMTITEAFLTIKLFKETLENKVGKQSHIELELLSEVRKFPSRVKCATLPWDILNIILKRIL